jgi:heme exporter protein A
MLTLTNLACDKGERPLFRGVSATVERGAWLHVAGANGRGKTSLLRLVCGLSTPTQGEVCWGGQPISQLAEAYRRELLYVGHDSGLQGMLSATDNLRWSAQLAGYTVPDSALRDALGRMGLQGREALPTRFLSQGQKRRVALAKLVLSAASLWVLDEPFVAMDVQALDLLTGLIAEHLAGGGLAVLTSHQPVQIGTVAPQILVLQ